MPDRRSHRGAHPEDAEAFAPAKWSALRQAVADLSLLLGRGYAEISALKLVGDRYGLTERQRMAVRRCSCTDAAMLRRRQAEAPAAELAGRDLLIDGYNALTTVEAALSGGLILAARDGCYRDLASMHGTFHRVEETIPALELIGEVLVTLGTRGCTWYLDSPVSNSGRLKVLMLETAARLRWQWEVAVVSSPDAVLSCASDIIATADSAILDRCARWFNLARTVVERRIPSAHVVYMG